MDKRLLKDLKKYYFKSFALGIISKNKEAYRKRQGHLIKEISKLFGANIDYDNADLFILYDFDKKVYTIKQRPLVLYGRYNKYSRKLPQTKYYCYKCKGKGCSFCKGKGVLIKKSVASIIASFLKFFFCAQNYNFVGAGREDIDVRMLGNGRPFLLYFYNYRKKPKNLFIIEKLFNAFHISVKINSLRYASDEDIAYVKKYRHRKLYLAESSLLIGKNIIGKYRVKQRTPKRVKKSRSDLIREREIIVKDVFYKKNRCFLIIEAEAGAYIKEFFSSDDGRTKPSISSLVNKKVKCLSLDVLEIL